MAKDAIFPDIDTTVQIRPTEMGIQLVVPCGVCGRQLRVEFPWQEIGLLLSGQPVAGVQAGAGGWVTEMRCTESCRDGMGNQNRVSFKLRHSETRALFEDEMARRQQQGG